MEQTNRNPFFIYASNIPCIFTVTLMWLLNPSIDDCSAMRQPAVTMVAIIWFYLLCMSTGLADQYRYEAWKSHYSRTAFELLQLVLLVVWTENRPWLQTQFAVQPAILQLASSSNAVRISALNVVRNARLDSRVIQSHPDCRINWCFVASMQIE